MARSLLDRFSEKFRVNDSTGCWDWTASTHLGYGQIGIRRRDGKHVPVGAHRVSYELYRGPIPSHLVIDHVCRNRGCVNPEHLRLLTRGENVMCGETIAAHKASATHCPNGHAYTLANIYEYKGHRICRQCRRNADQRRKPRQRHAAIYETSPDF